MFKKRAVLTVLSILSLGVLNAFAHEFTLENGTKFEGKIMSMLGEDKVVIYLTKTQERKVYDLKDLSEDDVKHIKDWKRRKDLKKNGLDIQPIIFDDKLWETSMADLYKKHADFEFEWLTGKQENMRSAGDGHKLFKKDSGEFIIKSQKGKPSMITIYLYNVGDNEKIGGAAYEKLHADVKKEITAKLSVSPKDISERKSGAVSVKKLLWKTEKTMYLLESLNPDYVRIKVAPAGTRTGANKTATRGSLKGNVTRDVETKDVFIDNIPMVDQGQKGYCACASAARIYNYYGRNDMDQHAIAKIANSTADSGTALNEMVSALKKVTKHLNSRVIVLYEYPKGLADLPTDDQRDDDRAWGRAVKKLELGLKEMVRDVNSYQSEAKKRGKGMVNDMPGMKNGKLKNADYSLLSNMNIFKRRCDPELYREVMLKKSSFKRFKSEIKKYINQGVPVGWCLQLGMFKEGDMPQMDGGHMRLIIGYNDAKNEIIYTDSWGKGHEYKRMDAAKAFCMSTALLVLPPTR